MIRAYLYTGNGHVETQVPAARFREALAREDCLLWLDIEGPEDNEIELLLEVFELHPLTVEDCILPNVRPKLEEFERYCFLVLQGMRRSEGQLKPLEVDVCLGANFLITVRSEACKSVDDNCVRVEKRSPIFQNGADHLCYAIVDSLMDSYLPVLDEIEERVDQLETRLLEEHSDQNVKDLLTVYHDLMTVRRSLTPHRDILARLSRGDMRFIRPANSLYFRDTHDRLLRISDLVDSAREVTTMSLEAHATIVSNRLNENMKTMTAFATLALPLVIVTGIFGMNFSEHPELGPPWLYSVLSALFIVSMPVMWHLFRKRKWL
jgi:magnesium transporter